MTGDLADALAERALARAAGGLAAAAVVLGTLAAVSLVLAEGAAPARTLPPVVLLTAGQLGGLAASAAALAGLRKVRSRPGTGPAVAKRTARLLDRFVVAVPVVGAALGAVVTAVTMPRAASLFVSLVTLLVLCQLAAVAVAVRGGLRRAAQAGS